MRIVSLVPSASEIICQLGSEDFLVAVSHECNYPLSLNRLPIVTSSNVSIFVCDYLFQALAKGSQRDQPPQS